MTPNRSRRAFLAGVGSTAAAALAGCTTGSSGQSRSYDTIRVATYQAYVDAPSTSAGSYVKKEFESRTDYTLEWVTPDGELNHFIQRRQQGVEIEADAFLGLTPQDLVRAAEEVDEPLFEGFNTDEVANAENIDDVYHFDPQRRVLPTGASYVSLVYDETVVDEPMSFEALTEPAYSGQLLLANPQSTTTGLLFLLWTVSAIGEDAYLDYWQQLMNNDVTVLGSWADAYNAYSQEEAGMVVSYSTDQVYAANQDQNMARHQIGFPNDQGYAYVDGLAKFGETDRDAPVRRFAEFMLDPTVQRKTAVKNVGIPTVSNASLPPDLKQYAYVPEDPVQLSYDVLAKSMSDWRDTWVRQVASG